MVKHSKGPWSWSFPEYENQVVISDSTGEEIARVASLSHPAEEDDANARLMAAAPELYDALELVLAVHAETLGDDLGMQVVAALKKARGDQ